MVKGKAKSPWAMRTEAPRIASWHPFSFRTQPRSARPEKYGRAHEQIINNENWYRDQPPALGQSFTAKKAAERHQEVLQILVRAAREQRPVRKNVPRRIMDWPTSWTDVDLCAGAGR